MTSSSTAITVLVIGVATLGLAACSLSPDRAEFASAEPSVYTPANDPWAAAPKPAPQKTAYVPPKGKMPILPPVPSEANTGLPPVTFTGATNQVAYQGPVVGSAY
ncbi:MAG: hypothetical protein P4L98_10260 [Ancalomicrobiaceae bacterium]|nr:hypothetical protein [Ancalomicrobiaceae bacterium]